jgi:hypothetical protein
MPMNDRKCSFLQAPFRTLLLVALSLAGCGALQRRVVARVAEASVVDGQCALEIEIETPSVHSPLTYLAGSKIYRSLLRLRVPSTSGDFLPYEVGVSEIAESGIESPLNWPLGVVRISTDQLEIDLHTRSGDTVSDFRFNGRYSVHNLAACRQAD